MWVTECFVMLDHFLPSTTSQKIKILKKWKKHQEILFYTSVPYMTITWCIVPAEIWSVTDRIFYHFGPFFALVPTNEKNALRYYHFTHVYHKWNSYNVWFLKNGACDGQKFLSFWTVLCPFRGRIHTQLATRNVNLTFLFHTHPVTLETSSVAMKITSFIGTRKHWR